MIVHTHRSLSSVRFHFEVTHSNLKFLKILIIPANTPRGFHVETTWKRPFPRRFNVESTWCVCRDVN